MRRRIASAALAGALVLGGGSVLTPAAHADDKCGPILMFSRAGATIDGVGSVGAPAVNAGGLGCLSDGGPDTRYLNPGATQVSIATTATPTEYRAAGHQERIDGMTLEDAFTVEFLNAAGDVLQTFEADVKYAASNGRWSTTYLDMLGVAQVRVTIDIITGQTLSSTYRTATSDLGV